MYRRAEPSFLRMPVPDTVGGHVKQDDAKRGSIHQTKTVHIRLGFFFYAQRPPMQWIPRDSTCLQGGNTGCNGDACSIDFHRMELRHLDV